jgi:hypothetical protein
LLDKVAVYALTFAEAYWYYNFFRTINMRTVFIVAAALLTTALPASANCLGTSSLSSDEIARFNAAPGAYFAGMNNGGVQEAVRKLAASDSATMAGIMGIFKTSPLATQTVITQGLGLAAKACQTTNEVQARSIQLAAADLPPSLRTVFDNFAGQRDVGSTGSAGGGAAGGASGGGTTLAGSSAFSNSGYSGPTSFSRSNTATAFTGGGGGPSVAGGGSTFLASGVGTTTFVTGAVPQPTSP